MRARHRCVARLLPIALLAGMVSACGVSKEVVRGIEADKDSEIGACRAELKICESRRESCAANVTRLEGEVVSWQKAARSDLEARGKAAAGLQDVSRELQACVEEAERAKREALALENQETELRRRLQNQLSDKSVEIEMLEGRLAVRVLDNILFRSGRADILGEGREVLDQIASVLARTDDKIRVEGHTDNVPIRGALKDRYATNWELSAARAASVVRHFQEKHGITPTRMDVVGRSEYQPVVSNDTPDGRGRNRRVEIVVSAK